MSQNPTVTCGIEDIFKNCIANWGEHQADSQSDTLMRRCHVFITYNWNDFLRRFLRDLANIQNEQKFIIGFGLENGGESEKLLIDKAKEYGATYLASDMSRCNDVLRKLVEFHKNVGGAIRVTCYRFPFGYEVDEIHLIEKGEHFTIVDGVPSSPSKDPQESPKPSSAPPDEEPSSGEDPQQSPKPSSAPPDEEPSSGEDPQQSPKPSSAPPDEEPSSDENPQQSPKPYSAPPDEEPSSDENPQESPKPSSAPPDEEPSSDENPQESPKPSSAPPDEEPSSGEDPQQSPKPSSAPPAEEPNENSDSRQRVLHSPTGLQLKQKESHRMNGDINNNSTKLRECLFIHIGQAGCQIGNEVWKLFCLEHGINPDGSASSSVSENSYGNIFMETSRNQFAARALYVDLEPTVVDEVRNGVYRKLFDQSYLISGKEDASNNYARGHYTLGKEVIDEIMDKIRKMTESCNSPLGFMIFHSFGGGTGSGLTSLLMEQLAADFPEKLLFNLAVNPSPRMSTAVVEPYNAVLGIHDTMKFADATVILDNEAMYRKCENVLDMECPTYVDLNRLTAQVVSSITASIRFSGTLNFDLADIATNVVPFPRLHFLNASYAPVTIRNYEQPKTEEITMACLDEANRMACCDNSKGKYMACCLLYRGDVQPSDVNSAIAKIKANQQKITFVDWCKTGFKVGINSSPPTSCDYNTMARLERAVLLLANNTALVDTFASINGKFDLMFNRMFKKDRAFVHWYIRESMEEEQFFEAREDLAVLEKDYEEAGTDSVKTDLVEKDDNEY